MKGARRLQKQTGMNIPRPLGILFEGSLTEQICKRSASESGRQCRSYGSTAQKFSEGNALLKSRRYR